MLFFSCHFHEFLSHGQENLENALRRIHGRSNTCGTLILEQSRLNSNDRADSSSTQWLYAQSNVLIHHLIKNAKILDAGEWKKFLLNSGCTNVSTKPTKGYCFSSFMGQSSCEVGKL